MYVTPNLSDDVLTDRVTQVFFEHEHDEYLDMLIRRGELARKRRRYPGSSRQPYRTYPNSVQSPTKEPRVVNLKDLSKQAQRPSLHLGPLPSPAPSVLLRSPVPALHSDQGFADGAAPRPLHVSPGICFLIVFNIVFVILAYIIYKKLVWESLFVEWSTLFVLCKIEHHQYLGQFLV